MKTICRCLKRAMRFGTLFMLGVSVTSCAELPGSGNSTYRWQEEVLLHDGNTIIVTRMVARGGRHEIGQPPPYKEQSLSFVMPNTTQDIVWKDEFSRDIGSASFLPMLLDVMNGTAYLVANPMGCLSYNKWGRPNPPYIVFKVQNNGWQRIPLEDLPNEIKSPNLIFSSPDTVVKKLGKPLVRSDAIQQIISRYPQPEYKTILREPVANTGASCPPMVPYGRGGWLGLDWFSNQPSLEACSQFCDRKNVSSDDCPCARLFKGETK